jgi:hypothetical protein
LEHDGRGSKSIGKQLILSDIEVHREQQPPKAEFFEPQNARQLAEILKAKWNELKPGPDLAMETAARLQLEGRIRNYAETFSKIISECEAARFART